ncbi:MAG: 4-hydroxy-tetrahydrodipicolinate reductase [Bacteroidota bacterium]
MNIVLIGYGKMGREIESIAQQRGHSIIGKFSSNLPLPQVSSDFYQSQKIHCCIDFSHASGVSKHAEICSLLGIPLVEGTTGWQHQQKDIFDLVRRNNGSIIYGNNFSVGAQMFFNIVRRAAEMMNTFSEYDVAIHETHHIQKKDAPSGTALTLSQILLSSMNRKTTVKDQFDTSVIQSNQIGISSTRIGNVSGTHSVLFHSPADEIELVHRAHNRTGFALGAVLAAELTQNFPGIFSFEELIFEKSIHRELSS